MKPWLKWTLVIVPAAMLAFLLYPMMPLGSLLWPMPAEGGPAITPAQLALMSLIFLIEATACGVAFAFLVFGRPSALGVPVSSRGRATAMYGALAWITGIWPFHMYAHLHHSAGTHATTLVIDYSFHSTIYLAATVLLFCVMSIVRERGGAAVSVTQLLTIAIPVGLVGFLSYPAMPIGQMLWPAPHAHGAAPTAVQTVLYAIDWLLQALVTGLGVAFLVHGRRLMSSVPAAMRSSVPLLFYGSIWVAANWTPHVILHILYADNMNALIAIEWVFHVTQYTTAVFMIPRFLRIMRGEQPMAARSALVTATTR